MNPADDDLEDADVPMLAIQGLQAAQRRSVLAGHPQVVARGDQLVRIDANGVTVLKQLPPRRTVDVQFKLRKA